MKTTLTLKSGTYYFFSQINLIKGKSKEIDLSELTLSELRGLKSHVNAGIIDADKDISDYRSEELEGTEEASLPPVIEPTIAEEKEETEEAEKAPEVIEEQKYEEVEETETKEDGAEETSYDEMDKDALLSEIKSRGLKTRYNREDKLREVLEEDDANK